MKISVFIALLISTVCFAKDAEKSRGPAAAENLDIVRLIRPQSNKEFEGGSVVRFVDREFNNVCYAIVGGTLATGTAMTCVPIQSGK